MASRFVYTGSKTNEISFPLGGLGTGCIGLAGNGRLIEWEIFNQPNKGSLNGFSHFCIKAEADGKVLDTRALHGDLHPPYTGERGFAKFEGFGWGPRRGNMSGVPHFQQVTFRGEFPFAHLDFEGSSFPGQVGMTAYNPFVPLNDRDSGLPAALFEIEVKNTQRRPITYSILCALSNPLPANNLNSIHQEQGSHMLHLASDGSQRDPSDDALRWADGNLTVATDAADVSYQAYWFKGAWFDELEVYWRNFTAPGRLQNRLYEPEEAGSGTTGMLAVHLDVEPGETRKARFAISWSFPNYVKYWASRARHGLTEAEEKPRWKNYYATIWDNSKDSAQYVMQQWDRLHSETSRFKQALFASDLPEVALEAVSANLSILKTPTILRLEDGTLYGWEGVCNCGGCCEGSCTHVWNYTQAFPFLFPSLERSMREANYTYNQDELGGMHFRLQLPLGSGWSSFRPCADGQFGDVLKTYRDWKICGDSDWLRKLWPVVRKSIEYAWSERNPDQWDPERTGVLQGRQHHTLDMELFGPNAWLTGYYLGALKAGAEMADHLGETDFAQDLRTLFAKGKAWADTHLFNGKYYHQLVDLNDRSVVERFDAPQYWNEEYAEQKYQIAEGCEIDQVIAQWHANLYGLGEIYDPTQVREALRSLFKYNFRPQMREYFNACRLYALNDEGGLVICHWPEDTYRPMTPLPYAGETQNGYEYAAAIQMIQSGLVEEGMAAVTAIRDRYDGEKRNPWNEFECGSNYARSMASYSLLNAFSGFRFDMVRKMIGFDPIQVHGQRFRCFWSLNTAWGEFEMAAGRVELRILYGELPLRTLALPWTATAPVGSVVLDGLPVAFDQDGGEINLQSEIHIKAGQRLDVILVASG